MINHPKRGEIWLVDLGYVAKVRPCLVISIPVLQEDRALITMIAHTTTIRNSRFEVKIKVKFLKEGAFDVQNMITIPNVKLFKKLGALTSQQIKEIEDIILL